MEAENLKNAGCFYVTPNLAFLAEEKAGIFTENAIKILISL